MKLLLARLSQTGRCALVGTLVGLLATQSFAQGGVTLTTQSPAKPETASFPGITQPLTINTQRTTNLPLVSIASGNAQFPEAPAVNESASAAEPPMLHLMLDQPTPDAQQALQSTPAPKQKVIQRPGMLVMGIIGAGFMGFGGYIYSIPTGSSNKATTLKGDLGTVFFAPGAAMAGLGFFFAFHKKKS